MERVNLIIIYSRDKSRVLMCKRTKEPYKGLLNFVGGKAETDEAPLDAAYRELFEETGITREDVSLTHFMNFDYITAGVRLEVFAGRLTGGITLREEVNPLLWVDRSEDFADEARFAGNCNIKHMLLEAECYEDILN